MFLRNVLIGAALLSCARPNNSSDSAEPGKYPIIAGPQGLQYHTGLLKKPLEMRGLGESHTTLADCDNLPETFDLRDLKTVPPMKNQGQCGSCWAFSKSGSLESAILASGKPYTNLSEQELVSCDKQQYGCQGGFLSNFDYQIKHGQGLEKDFRYTASDSACKSIPVAAKGTSFAYIGAANRGPTEKELKCAMFKSHTVPWMTVSANNNWSNPPRSINTPYTACGSGQTNHAVGVVGWTKDGFIMKNSWGANWGDKGYATLKLGCDSFGEESAFIMIEGSLPCKPPLFKLPGQVEAEADATVLLGVLAVSGTNYQWYKDGSAMAGSTNSQISVAAEVVDAVYKLVAKNNCGQTESSVRVKLVRNSKEK